MKYIKPDFDVTIYEVEDICLDISQTDPDGDDWNDVQQ